MNIWIIVALFFYGLIHSTPFPIGFSISETKIVKEIPKKDKDFAYIIPGNISTYIYTDEDAYYNDYRRSYYAITRLKGGWDCMRHYEILANGCIPYFINIDACPRNTMHLLPKKLIKEAMHLRGVSQGHIDHRIFDSKRYYEIVEELLEYTRQYLSGRGMAQYLLNTVNYKGGSVLFIANDKAPDYLKSCMIIGLKELLQSKVIEIPKADYIYTNFTGNPKAMYGKGFTYTKVIQDVFVDRENIEERIKNREFALIIYGYVHHGLPFYDIVTHYYSSDNIVYICGEDIHSCSVAHLKNLFLREHYF